MLEAVIFDMDGVIIDSEPMHLAIEKSIFKELGIHVTEEEHNSYIGTTSYYMWDLVKKKYGLIDEVSYLVENDRNLYLDYLDKNKNGIKPIHGVIDLLKMLKGDKLKLAVASSSPINVIEKVINTLNLKDYFDVLVTGDYVKESKPQPDIFLYAAKMLKVNPLKCIVIEDSMAGTIAAKRAEMKCIGYKNINSGNQDLRAADIIIDNYNKISMDLLKNMR